MSDFLERMRGASALRVARAQAIVPEALLLAQARAGAPPPGLSLHGFDLIGEIKRYSPAAGALGNVRGEPLDVVATARAYADAGAAAVSVLTEPAVFGGSLADLRMAADALRPLGVPAMRKDFLTDPYQVVEARAHGAGGVLLMVALLDDAQLSRMLETAFTMKLFVLLEAFDAGELERAARIVHSERTGRTLLVGVNARDLRTLAVDTERLDRLADRLPAGAPAVAESGIEDSSDAARMAAAGYRLALVGTALMRSDDPGDLLRSMLLNGRRAAAERVRNSAVS